MGWSRFLPAGGFVVLIIFLGIGLTRDPSVLPTEMIDREVPAFELAELRDEELRVTQADLIGEVTLLNVFGSWCVACLQEHPTLMQLSRDDTVRIAGVNWRDARDDALEWLVWHGDPYDIIVFDEASDLAIELGVTGAPETFVIDQTGRIRYKQIGPITPEVWRDTIRPVLDVLAAEAQNSPALETTPTPLPETAGEEQVGANAAPEVIESRTEAVSKTLRCVVCQNQSIYDSNAPLAQDMRRLVRKRVIAGDSDDEVRAYLRYRYGDYVLMRPPLQLNTILLWGAPILFILFGVGWFLFRPKRKIVPVEETQLSEADRARIAAALDESQTPS